MNRIDSIKKAARNYCEKIATIDVQSGAIHGNMETVFSSLDMETAFIAGAEYMEQKAYGEGKILYTIVHPLGYIIPDTFNSIKHICISQWLRKSSRSWDDLYKSGYRCKKVKVEIEIID